MLKLIINVARFLKTKDKKVTIYCVKIFRHHTKDYKQSQEARYWKKFLPLHCEKDSSNM